jgi:Domain of unknown function (DUF4383)
MVDTIALVFGIIYLSVGIIGFVLAPNGGLLLGIFEVSAFHHIFHVGIGALGIVAGYMKIGRLYCRLVGGVLLFLGVIGFLIPMLVGAFLASATANLLTDNMLHLVTGTILGYFGLISPSPSVAADALK